MIASLFLSASAVGTVAVVYFVAPAGRGLHRYVVPRSVLRAEAARSTEQVEELVFKLVGLAAELDAVSTARDDAQAGLGKATLRIADLEKQLREADQRREENTALKAQLANVNAIRPLPLSGSTPQPVARPVPLNRAPFALGPAQTPS